MYHSHSRKLEEVVVGTLLLIDLLRAMVLEAGEAARQDGRLSATVEPVRHKTPFEARLHYIIVMLEHLIIPQGSSVDQSRKFEDSVTLLNELDLSKTLVEEEDDRSVAQELDKKAKIVKETFEERKPIKKIDTSSLRELIVMNARVVRSAEQERILTDARVRVSPVSSFKQVNVGSSMSIERNEDGER